MAADDVFQSCTNSPVTYDPSGWATWNPRELKGPVFFCLDRRAVEKREIPDILRIGETVV